MNVFTGNRIGRLVYFGWMLPICVTSGFITTYVKDNLYGDEASTVLWITGIISAAFVAFPIVKRLHDLNKSGWLWLLGLIPLVNVFFGIYLIFGKGTEGSNDYGASPEKLLKKNRIGPFSVVGRSDDDVFYQQAYEELENGQIDKALWAKIFAQCGGNESKAKALYIRSRVEHLKSTSQQKKNNVANEPPVNFQKTGSEESENTARWLIPLGVVVVLLGIVIFSLREKNTVRYRYYSSFNNPSFSQKEDVADPEGRTNESFSSDTYLPMPPQAGKMWVANLGSEVSMEFMPIPAGSFRTTIYYEGYKKTDVLITISRPFWMASTEVTQRQYRQIMGQNPSEFQGLDNPVERVSWKDAMVFCQKLTEQDIQSGRIPKKGYEYTLPSAAQWRHAHQAGMNEGRGEDLNVMGWYDLNSGGKPHSVGQLRPNQLGLYDMQGNVEELCLDRIADLTGGPQWFYGDVDPIGKSGECRLVQGGSWDSREDYCKEGTGSVLSADKEDLGTFDLGFKNTGFRPVLSIVVTQ